MVGTMSKNIRPKDDIKATMREQKPNTSVGNYHGGPKAPMKEQNPVTGDTFGAGNPQNKAKGFEYWQNHPEELAKRLRISVDQVPEQLAFWQAELEGEGCKVDQMGDPDSPPPSPLPAADRRAMGINENYNRFEYNFKNNTYKKVNILKENKDKRCGCNKGVKK